MAECHPHSPKGTPDLDVDGLPREWTGGPRESGGLEHKGLGEVFLARFRSRRNDKLVWERLTD